MITPLEMNHLRLVKLPNAGLSYVSETLQKGGPLASSLNPISEGDAFTFLPAGSDVESLNYREGGVLTPEEAFEAQRAMCSILSEYVDRTPSNIVLFENQSFNISDPAVADDNYIFECEGVLYHYRTKLTGTGMEDQFADALGITSQYPTIILLGSAIGQIPQKTNISHSIAQHLITDMRHVFVGSYDEEGFVVWSRRKNELGIS